MKQTPVSFVIIRLNFKRGFIAGNGIINIIEFSVSIAHVKIRFNAVRLDGNCFLIADNSFCGSALSLQDHAQIVECTQMIRLNRKGFLKIRYRFFDFALILQGNAHIIECFHIIRLDGSSFLKTGNSIVKLSQMLIRKRHAVKSFGIIRLKFNGFLII